MSNAYRRFELLPTSAAVARVKYAGIATGDKVSTPEVGWAKSQRTLLLVLQKGCHFCTESAEFYRSVARVSVEKESEVLSRL